MQSATQCQPWWLRRDTFGLICLASRRGDKTFLLDALMSPPCHFGEAVSSVVEKLQQTKRQSAVFIPSLNPTPPQMSKHYSRLKLSQEKTDLRNIILSGKALPEAFTFTWFP